MIIRICEKFENDLALGLLDLLKNAVEEIDGFDNNQNRHIDVEMNSVSIRLSIKY
jgi:hemerythrin-like domain-containing protein